MDPSMPRADDRMPQGRPGPGERVRVRYTKWGDLPHWEWDATVLDEDEHGIWLHMPAGTHMSRPGMSFDEEVSWVALAPHGQPWLAGFYPDTKWVAVYVDMATVPQWRRLDGDLHGWEVSTVDLDLDVVLTSDGHLYVDDEDEFEQHRVELGYPDDVVELALRSRDWVHAAIASGTEPFGRAGTERLRSAD